jgi:hypothetical protein
MGLEFNGSRGGRKTPQEVAKAATIAHNKKKAIILTTEEPIKFLEIPTEEVVEDVVVEATIEESEEFVAAEVDTSPVNVADLVVAWEGKTEEGGVESLTEDPITEQSLRDELGTLKKAGLKDYAADINVDISEAKTNKDIIEAIVSASF